MKIVDIGAGTGVNKALMSAGAELNGQEYDIEVLSYSSMDLDESEMLFQELLQHIDDAQFIMLRLHGGIPYFKKFFRLKEVLDASGKVVFLQSEMHEEMEDHRYLFPLSDKDYDLLHLFVHLAGEENAKGILFWALNTIEGMDVQIPQPSYPRVQGIYHPDHDRDIGLADYLADLDPERPCVGFMFWQGQWLTGDLKAVDALIRELELQGLNVIAVFGQSSPDSVTGGTGIARIVEDYFMEQGRARIQVLVLNMGFSQLSLSSPGDGKNKEKPYNFFEKLNVPVLQAMTTYSTYDQWKGDIQGIGAMELSSNIVWPEYDGQIITVPIATTENKEGHGSREAVPIADRIRKVASLAKRWTQLAQTPVSERKMAILLHQNPPRNDGIGGASGLDTPESVVRLLGELKEKGYRIDRIPENGNEIINEILAGLTNDTQWISPEQMLKRSAGRVPADRYGQWLDNIPEKCASKIEEDWGEAPGELFVSERDVAIPGIVNGNIFIGLQPPRGFLEQIETMYHNTDLTIPHHYLAYYRWLKYEFGAQVVIHFGTHGTLEWLPGKAAGMSDECFPDIVLDDLPDLYPYIIDNPGEGIQAKRRAWSVILDHLIPAMARADGYDELEELNTMLQDIFRAQRGKETSKASQLLSHIHQYVLKLELYRDLGFEDGITEEEMEDELDDLYDYICDLRDNIIKDGLHVFGSCPPDERFKEMLYSLTRLKNGPVPSLRQSIASYRGYELARLQDEPSITDERTGQLNGSLLEQIDLASRDLINEMHSADYDTSACVRLCGTAFPGHDGQLETVVSHICEVIRPALQNTVDEMNNCISGLDGCYIPPGPSGPPTRGNAHLLPTGKNFYSIDPAIIPTPAAWEVGHTLADQMVERYIKEEGKYPESVGIVVFATDTMKTGGDDIAYILWLLGLRPQWSARGGVITGLEVIPLEELNRPRVDVTLRITGLFRDAFPNLVELIDEGVRTIAGLDESAEKNYLVKHLKEELLEAVKSGMEMEVAREMALIRIFGCPPGTYGAGVAEVVQASQWEDKKDLADVYVNWGAHAYGKGLKGEKMPELFKKRLGKLNVTVKNHNSRELDILDNDDDFMYHGGMISCVKTYGGKDPLPMVGDSSDPQRPVTRTVEEEGRFVYRSRVLNPKWLEGLKQHGYRGAQELSALVDFSFGWDATSDVMDDWMYQSLAEKFLFDDDTREWIRENNPYALREMAGRLLEAFQRDMWDADEETIRKLTAIYMETEDILEELTDRSADGVQNIVTDSL